MKFLHKNILIEFIEDRTKIDLGNGLQLYKPERYEFDKDTGDGQTFAQVTDRRAVNPQVARILHGNDKYPHLQPGDIVFVHYGTIELAEKFEYEETKGLVIDASLVFFKIVDGEYLPVPGVFLGKRVVTDAIKTTSGIYLTPEATKTESCRITLSHIYNGSTGLKIGDTVLTVDDNQYEFEHNRETYIMLKEQYIWGVSA